MASSATASSATSPVKPPQPSPGSLPQTDQRPSGHTTVFAAEMRALWRGIRRGSVQAAMPAFFPEGAYVQVKAIADAKGDFIDRLVGDYALDIGAAHGLLGAGAREARLMGVQVPAAYAHWVPPGACDNRVGYYEVPNARLVYSENGELRSFGVASMISWRGVWYIVHLGEVLRPVVVGVVDAPSAGTGASAPSSTC